MSLFIYFLLVSYFVIKLHFQSLFLLYYILVLPLFNNHLNHMKLHEKSKKLLNYMLVPLLCFPSVFILILAL